MPTAYALLCIFTFLGSVALAAPPYPIQGKRHQAFHTLSQPAQNELPPDYQRLTSGLSAWLGVAPHEIGAQSLLIHPEFPSLRFKALASFIAETFKTTYVLNYAIFNDNTQIAPEYAYFETTPEKEERLPYAAFFFVADKANPSQRVVIALRKQDPNSAAGYIYIYFAAGRDTAYAKQLAQRMDDFAATHNNYKNHVLTFHTDGWWGQFAFLKGVSDLRFTWDDLILKNSIKQQVRFETEDFMRSLPLYRERGLPTKRGVLLAGPPGTGKTLINKILVTQLRGSVSIVVLTAKSVLSARDIAMVYTGARYLSPSMVLMEDFDMLGGTDRYGNARREILNELLNQLDGVERNGDLLTVGTTNKPESMDKALLRPGRFDVHVTVDLPDFAERVKLLAFFTAKDVLAPDVSIDHYANLTEGFAPVRLKEFVSYARRLAFERGSVTPDGRLLLTATLMNEALASMANTSANASTSNNSEEE